MTLSRRQALSGALGLGIAIEFVGGRAFAASQGDEAKKKLVVIVCRGGLDGLTLSPPVGDPNYAGLRGKIAVAGFGQPDGALKLDDTFGLHPSMTAIHALALKGQARIVPAVATPDRERSHFEAQGRARERRSRGLRDELGLAQPRSGRDGASGVSQGDLGRADRAADPARTGRGGVVVARRRGGNRSPPAGNPDGPLQDRPPARACPG